MCPAGVRCVLSVLGSPGRILSPVRLPVPPPGPDSNKPNVWHALPQRDFAGPSLFGKATDSVHVTSFRRKQTQDAICLAFYS